MTFQFYAPSHHTIEPALQKVEIKTFFQIPHFTIIGLPGPEIRESTERVRAALISQGFEIPRRKIIVNLSPAGLRKQGTASDLAIALSLLFHSENIAETNENILVAGELGLQGNVLSGHSVFRILKAADNYRIPRVILSLTDAALAGEYMKKFSALFANPPQILGVANLRDAYEALCSSRACPFVTPSPPRAAEIAPLPALLPITSWLQKRVLLTAAIGVHHLILLGAKGIGKTRSMDWIRALRENDSVSAAAHHYCLQELLDPQQDLRDHAQGLPIRQTSPHIKPAALLGSARADHWTPGELQLAHLGILIADEFGEWPRDSREILRAPLESAQLQVNSVHLRRSFPCQFQLIATSNLCPCGGIPKRLARAEPNSACRCRPAEQSKYLARLSGPILDRIDLSLVMGGPPESAENPRPAAETLEAWKPPFQNARSILKSVSRTIAAAMNAGSEKLETKVPGQWTPHETETWIRHLESQSCSQKTWGESLGSSSLRSRHKIVRIATTLAALDGKEIPESQHFQEAKWFRPESVIRSLLPSSASPLALD